MKFRYPPAKAVFELPLNEPQAEYAASLGYQDVELVRSVVVDAGGITVVVSDDRNIRFTPEYWDEYWRHGDRVEGIEACEAWAKYQEYAFDHNARVLLAQIQAGELTFPDAREQWPELFGHPRVQAALARAYVDGTHDKRGRGRRAKVAEPTWVLYEWACWYHLREKGVSFEVACLQACLDHPELVPSTWRADPADSLSRLARRHLDHHYKRSQDRKPRDSRSCLSVLINPAT